MSEFERLCQRLKQRLSPLNGLNIDPSGPLQAAVVLLLRDRGDEPEILIIKRAAHPYDPWSGHLALPGGRVAPGDEDLWAAAVRETGEEVGIHLEAGGQLLGRLETLWPGNPRLPRIAITPLVAAAPPEATVRLNEEVDAAYWLSLERLKQRGRSDVYRVQIQGQVRQWPAYPSPGGPVWGITERILTHFLARLD